MTEPTEDRPNRRRLFAMLGGGAVALAVIIGLVIALSGGEDETAKRRKARVTTTTTTTTLAPTTTTTSAPSCVPSGGSTASKSGAGTGGVALLRLLEVHPSGQAVSGGPDGMPACAEHVVFTFQGDVTGEGVPGYTVEYRQGPLALSPSDIPVTVQGSAYLVVRFEPAQNHPDVPGTSEPVPQQLVPTGTRWVKEVRQLEDFEAVNVWVIGLDGQVPFVVNRPGVSPWIWITVGA